MRRFVAALTVVVMTTLAGCNGEPEPRFEPTQTPSPSDPTTSETSEPEPEAWEERSKAGAVAFARHWVDVFNEAVLSGNTKALADISGDECETCNGFMGRIEDVYGAGGRYLSHGWRVTDSAVQPGGSDQRQNLVLRITRAAERYRESGSGTLQRNAPSEATFTLEVQWIDGAWSAERMVLL